LPNKIVIMDKKMTYAKAYAEMERLMLQLQQEDIKDLDELVRQVERLNELILFCKTKLSDAESELNALQQRLT
jgi:exodeoxyribonuclease VII small subunit